MTDSIIGFKDAKCPTCKRIFVPAPQNVFKANGRDYCCPTCFMNRKKRKSSYEKVKQMKTARPVAVYETNGDYVGKFPTIAEAARTLHTNIKCIHKCCKGEQESTNGYVFKYLTR